MDCLATLLLLTALTIPTPTLVLRNGARIDVDGSVRQEETKVVFRSFGVLYSMSATQVDFDATRAAGLNVTMVRGENDRAKLKVSPEERDRLLRALEQNHTGTPADPAGLKTPPQQQPPSGASIADTDDEWSWRRNARAHEESVRRAKEELQLLNDRAEKLRQQIRNFVSLGYKANQFTYQTSELQTTYDSLPRAQLEVERAQRELDQFRDDARRLGVMPGWLR
jgi:hypothetical protein